MSNKKINIDNFLQGKIGPIEVIDYVEKKLVKQGCRSTTNNGNRCVYRGANGAKCAVGHLIPDSIYDKNMETSIYSLVKDHVYFAEYWGLYERETCKIMCNKMEFLAKLQRLHDSCPDNDFVQQIKLHLDFLRDIYKNIEV